MELKSEGLSSVKHKRMMGYILKHTYGKNYLHKIHLKFERMLLSFK